MHCRGISIQGYLGYKNPELKNPHRIWGLRVLKCVHGSSINRVFSNLQVLLEERRHRPRLNTDALISASVLGIPEKQLADKIDAKPWDLPGPNSRSHIGKKTFKTGVNLESWVTMEPGLKGDVWVLFNPDFLGCATVGTGRKDGRTLEFTQEGQMLEQAAELLEAIDASFDVGI